MVTGAWLIRQTFSALMVSCRQVQNLREGVLSVGTQAVAGLRECEIDLVREDEFGIRSIKKNLGTVFPMESTLDGGAHSPL